MAAIVTYWLLPAEPARNFFTELIAELAARFDAPIFLPHLTLFCASEASRAPADVIDCMNEVEIDLPLIGIDKSKQFPKTLFARFEKTTALQQLIDAIAALSRTSPQELSDPHLSLLYKRLTRKTRSELTSSIKLPFREVNFRSVCAVRCALPTRGEEDVRAS
jgi:2'-5' RNA ligase